MLELFVNPLQISWGVWLVTLACAFINGLSKSGLKGIGMVTVPIMAIMYGGMSSTGVLLPFLLVGDFFAFRFYRKSVQWKYVKRLLPWVLPGVIVAVFVGNIISDALFRNIMAIIVIICVGLVIYFDFAGKKTDLSKSKLLSRSTGLAGGFASMMGNAAGPLFNLYLLSMKLPKNSFIGTGAIFFLSINIIKFPFHFFIWESITLQSLQMNFVMIPAVFIGAVTGKNIVRYIPEKTFRYFVFFVIILSSFLLLVR